jgi:hypothetical protein
MADLITVLQSDVMKTIDDTDRQNLAKYLMIVKVARERHRHWSGAVRRSRTPAVGREGRVQRGNVRCCAARFRGRVARRTLRSKEPCGAHYR